MEQKFIDIIGGRRFVGAVVGIVALFVVAAFPEFENQADMLVNAITVIVVGLIGGLSVQASVKEHAQTSPTATVDDVEKTTLAFIRAFERVTGVDVPDSIEQAVAQEVQKEFNEYAEPDPTAPVG